MKEPEETMDIEKTLQEGAGLLSDWVITTNSPESNRLDVTLDAAHLKEAVKKILDSRWGYLSAITGLDNQEYITDETGSKKINPDHGSLEVLYHFCAGAAVLTLRVTLPYDRPVVDSIYEVCPTSTLYEREAAELFGIEFTGTPVTDHLVLPDDWPAGVYPLRKAFTGLNKKA